VWVTVKLQHQPQLSTIEIHDETVQHMLPAKLEAEQLAVAQQRPGVSLGRRRLAAEPARERDFLPDADRT